MKVQNITPEKFFEENINLYFKAIQNNRLENVKLILTAIESIQNQIASLKGKVLVNHLIQKKSGDTGLHICASHGFVEIMKYLVEEKGGNLEQVNLDGKTALHDAAQFSQFEAVNYLLEKGANVNVVKRADWTPLMLACTKQNVPIVKSLLEHDAYPFFVNKDGWNCFHIAAREGNVEIIQMILNHQKPEMRRQLCQSKSRNGRKPIHTSVMHGHFDLVQLLVKEGTVEETNEADHCGTTAIMEACRFGFLNIVEYLKEYAQTNLNDCDKQGLNCMHIAAEAGQSDVIKALVLKYAMDINLGTEPLNMTPLHWSAKEGQIEAVKTLLDLGAQTKLLDSKGRSPQDVAGIFGHTDSVHLLKN